jgi:hypothetical protein
MTPIGNANPLLIMQHFRPATEQANLVRMQTVITCDCERILGNHVPSKEKSAFVSFVMFRVLFLVIHLAQLQLAMYLLLKSNALISFACSFDIVRKLRLILMAQE